MPSNGIFSFKVTNLHQSGVQHGIIGQVILYDSNLMKLAAIGNWEGRFYPGDSQTSANISVSGGINYYIKVPRFAVTDAAPYRLENFFQ